MYSKMYYYSRPIFGKNCSFGLCILCVSRPAENSIRRVADQAAKKGPFFDPLLGTALENIVEKVKNNNKFITTMEGVQ